jgi:hypothetical protein
LTGRRLSAMLAVIGILITYAEMKVLAFFHENAMAWEFEVLRLAGISTRKNTIHAAQVSVIAGA